MISSLLLAKVIEKKTSKEKVEGLDGKLAWYIRSNSVLIGPSSSGGKGGDGMGRY